MKYIDSTNFSYKGLKSFLKSDESHGMLFDDFGSGNVGNHVINQLSSHNDFLGEFEG